LEVFCAYLQFKERSLTLRNIRVLIVSVTFLAAASLSFAQRPGLEVPLVTPGPGWKTCVRCENDAHVLRAREEANVDTHPFDPHDLSGVWGDMVHNPTHKGPTTGAVDLKEVG
jgi:hypothetical protein